MVMPNCNSCTGCVVNPIVEPVPGSGQESARLMFIGEAPTVQAQSAGMPFPIETPSGRVLDTWLQHLGITRKEVYLTNVVKCPKRDEIWGRQRESCLPWLAEEIRVVQPSLIVTMGGEVHKCFTSDNQPSRYKAIPGSPLYRVWKAYPGSGGCQEYNGIVFFALVHPSSAARLSKDIPDYLRKALDRLGQLWEGVRDNRPVNPA